MFKKLMFFFIINVIIISDTYAMNEGNEEDNFSLFLQARQSFPNFNFEKSDQRDLNKWAALYGVKIYNYLNNSINFGYPTEEKYFTTSEHWELFTPFMEPTVHFIKKKGISASVALESLLMNEGRFDCRIAQRIVFMECIRKLIGDVHFNRLSEQFEQEPSNGKFTQSSTKELVLDGNEDLNPYLRLTSTKSGSLYRLGIVGLFGYTPNLREYAILHPQGFVRGENGLMCLGSEELNPSYTGYGDFFKAHPRSWDEMMTHFRKETLTLSTSEDINVDATDIREELRGRYIEQKKSLHRTDLQRQKTLVESLQDTYEVELQNLQNNFSGPAFFIDLEKVKVLLKN